MIENTITVEGSGSAVQCIHFGLFELMNETALSSASMPDRSEVDLLAEWLHGWCMSRCPNHDQADKSAPQNIETMVTLSGLTGEKCRKYFDSHSHWSLSL